MTSQMIFTSSDRSSIETLDETPTNDRAQCSAARHYNHNGMFQIHV